MTPVGRESAGWRPLGRDRYTGTTHRTEAVMATTGCRGNGFGNNDRAGINDD